MSPTPEAVKQDSDAVARAASARADKLEKQVIELKAKLEARPVSAKDESMQRELDSLRDRHNGLLEQLEVAASVKHSLKREPKPLEERYKGTKSYRSTQAHYSLGRYYQPGEVITVTDERPSKYWVLVEKRVVATEFVAVAPVEAPSTPEV